MTKLALVSALLLFPAAAGAQATADSRWSTWLGCWELVLESSREPSELNLGQPGRGAVTQPRSTPRPQVCVQPAPGGATFSTRVGTQTPIEQTVIADGRDRPIVDADCHGSERAEWSKDGMRLFANADLTCTGDRGSRRVSGLAILGPSDTWTDIQAVDISGQESVRVRRYRRVSQTARSARSRVEGLTLDQVEEASSKISPRALEAALVETGSTFDLSGKRLIALQDAGVAPGVIDLMVALSYPERFVVERTTRSDRASMAPLFDDPFFIGWAFGYPMWSDLYGFYSPLYGSYSPYFYSPFAYSYLRGYDPRYFGGTSAIVIGEGGGSTSSGQPSGTGRVVDGLGYTRVRPREAESAANGQRGVTTTTVGSSSSGSSSSSSSSGGSSGGGSVSTQGFSSGGSGGDGGRTAQPR